MADYESMRREHKPKTIRLLLLAISPPMPWDGHNPFFYNEADMPAYGLFQATMNALYPDRWTRIKKELLDQFQNVSGFYLIDASSVPLKGDVNDELEKIREYGSVLDSIKRLAEDGSFADRQIRLVIIGKKMHEIFHNYLNGARLDTSKGQFVVIVVNDVPIRFPKDKRLTDQFVRDLAKIFQDSC